MYWFKEKKIFYLYTLQSVNTAQIKLSYWACLEQYLYRHFILFGTTISYFPNWRFLNISLLFIDHTRCRVLEHDLCKPYIRQTALVRSGRCLLSLGNERIFLKLDLQQPLVGLATSNHSCSKMATLDAYSSHFLLLLLLLYFNLCTRVMYETFTFEYLISTSHRRLE